MSAAFWAELPREVLRSTLAFWSKMKLSES